MTHGGITATGVARSFGTVRAVADATFEAQPGRITGLVGPNGAGKTTLMLMLASLLAPDEGAIRVGGVDPIQDPRAARQLLGWMSDGFGAWSSLTVRESLITTARMYDFSREDAEARAAQLIAESDLVALGNTPARVLSRGQKQKLGLARALVHSPSVLILDEPASGLDPQARIDLRERLQQFARNGGTVLISSHVLSELDELVDDAVFMKAGAVVDVDHLTTRAATWRVRFLRQTDSAVALLAQTAGVDPAHVATERGFFTVPFASEEAAAQALTALVAAKAQIVEFAPTSGRLERSFLALGDEGGAA